MPYYIVQSKTLKLDTINADRNCGIRSKADIKDCLGGNFREHQRDF